MYVIFQRILFNIRRENGHNFVIFDKLFNRQRLKFN